MNVFDVHVNRSPVDGTIIEIRVAEEDAVEEEQIVAIMEEA